MAEWCTGCAKTKVARNVPTPSLLSSSSCPMMYLAFILQLVVVLLVYCGVWLVLPLHCGWCLYGWCSIELPLSRCVCFQCSGPALRLTWVPNCSLVNATADLSSAFIQIYHNHLNIYPDQWQGQLIILVGVRRILCEPYLVFRHQASWSIRATSQSIGSTCACNANQTIRQKCKSINFSKVNQSIDTPACKHADKW